MDERTLTTEDRPLLCVPGYRDRHSPLACNRHRLGQRLETDPHRCLLLCVTDGESCGARSSADPGLTLSEVEAGTGEARSFAGRHRADRHAQFPSHRPRPDRQADTAEPRHRHLHVLRPVIQAGRLASPAGPADRPLHASPPETAKRKARAEALTSLKHSVRIIASAQPGRE